jgi:hypothetical protein
MNDAKSDQVEIMIECPYCGYIGKESEFSRGSSHGNKHYTEYRGCNKCYNNFDKFQWDMSKGNRWHSSKRIPKSKREVPCNIVFPPAKFYGKKGHLNDSAKLIFDSIIVEYKTCNCGCLQCKEYHDKITIIFKNEIPTISLSYNQVRELKDRLNKLEELL